MDQIVLIQYLHPLKLTKGPKCDADGRYETFLLPPFELTVKKRSTPEDDVEGDIRIRFFAAGIEDDVSLDD